MDGLKITMRQNIVKCLSKDIFCVTETHLTGNEVVSVDSYKWYGHNRVGLHRRAVKGSGGVGIFGILGLLFESDGFNFVVYVCYLSPEGSLVRSYRFL